MYTYKLWLHGWYCYKVSWTWNLMLLNDAKWSWLSETYRSVIIQTFNFSVTNSMRKQVFVTVLCTRFFCESVQNRNNCIGCATNNITTTLSKVFFVNICLFIWIVWKNNCAMNIDSLTRMYLISVQDCLIFF